MADIPASLVIRPAVPGDEPGIALVHVRSWQEAYRGLIPQDYLDSLDVSQRTEAWRRQLPAEREGRGDTLVAETGGEIAGFAGVCASRDPEADPERTGEIPAIYLRPDSIGQGLGRVLMAAAVRRLTDFGYAEAILWVLDGNARARRFYERAGWTADGAAKDDDMRGFTIREVRYRRPLP